MKKLLHFFIIFFVIIGLFSPQALSFTQHRDKMIGIENYLIKHKREIEKYIQIYEIEQEESIVIILKRIEKLINYIRRAKDKDLNAKEKKVLITYFTNEIKGINTAIKSTINQKKELQERKEKKIQEKQKQLAKLLANKLDQLIIKLYNKYNGQNIHIQKHLEALYKISKQLRGYNQLFFKSQKESSYYLKNIIKNLKRELQALKKNI